ncbi:hypothetical protein [Acidomonas methanolica]|uniref:hypothetical protein n=1 Tax=Acidomonas methanolica TaxID=437 RepID=UPI00351CC89C|nr:hypothetical protein [Acidomonas methanolica]
MTKSAFERFDVTLRKARYRPMSGRVLDASLLAAPKQPDAKSETADLQTRT